MFSMTGFGRAENTTDHYQAKVEINSVNRKQGEVLVQLPKSLNVLEADIRKFVLSKIQRGRVHVSISLTAIAQPEGVNSVDKTKLQSLVEAAKEIEQLTGEKQKLSLSDILRAGNIISLEDQEIDEELAKAAIDPAVEQALEAMIKMRALEGEHMKNDVSSRINTLECEVEAITSHAPSVIEHYRNSLHRRLKEAGLEIDLNDDRVLKEIGIFAERCDISEEITRLDSHFAKFREYLAANDPVGRSLDFLCQEMNREFNTIGSKANDATLAQHVVNCKTELEKAREQVQNIE